MSAMAALFRRASGSAFRSLICRNNQSFCCSSTVSSRFLLKNVPQNTPKTSFLLPFRFISSAKKVGADENLIRVLQSEIQCAEESDDLNQKTDLPKGFPFEIIDNPGEQIITLKREFEGESIKVEVHMADFDGEEDDKDEDDDDDERSEKQDSAQPSVSLIVDVTKGEGPCLQFCCTAYPDDLTIDSMFIKNQDAPEDQLVYEGPEFSDLDENLQKALYKYLEVRGITNSLTSCLHDYMINKDSREYLGWLKSMKEFLDK